MCKKYCYFCGQNDSRLYKLRYRKGQGTARVCTSCRRQHGIRVLYQFLDGVKLSKAETNFEKHKKALLKENFPNMVRGNGNNIADFFYTKNSRSIEREFPKFLRNSRSVEAEFSNNFLRGGSDSSKSNL
jgi:hypothetical protein